MTPQFDCFIIFAEMRTGSNFLESNLDQFPGLKCYGEAFNPYFMVSPKTKELFGVTTRARDKDPLVLVEAIKKGTDGLPGFRFFHDHDPRVFEALIDDPRCAKVVLTRNHLEAYVSRKIAWETDQWQLNDVKDVIKKRATFHGWEFERLFYRMKDFQLQIKDRLQRSGQTAFYIDYEDAQDLAVLNGLARFLGVDHEITEFAGTFKKQNPESLEDKVVNYDKLLETVGKIDVFDLHRIPNFEPSRPAAVTTYVLSEATGMVFMPVKGGPKERVQDWMNRFGETQAGFSQKMLRKWKREHKGHRSFTVLRHPVERLHSVFCHHFLRHGPDTYWDIKHALRESYGVEVPEAEPDESWSVEAHKQAFVQFIDFVDRNLKGQTGIRVDAAWASQSAVLQGFAGFALPDHVLREDQLEEGLGGLLAELGITMSDWPAAPAEDQPFALSQIYDTEIEKKIRKLYQRDYMMFGFRPLGR
ncbi:sulfotransferase family 2 domain-containing protein [Aliiroseovarius sp. KMU-50]|uniref:Sulfotransferase family 2 domain-containing protein n=1 Tax=Aliiroseovarius salicola TaxID=3009082 RepID=A0ABT4VXP6_9RHOB|nr:sulfotransferase family 2 domain-containing protein [Aliiroseovarius sp. KMU-50]MDA5093038.1 sulfotransferase family 2 domain-containing protein [Aliiroseovarius sp. KMU-50]